jgi:DNA-binding SARP family transcriptional activator
MDIQLLGPVELHSRGHRVHLGPRRQRFVLAVLALEANRHVSVERLVEVTWPAGAPRTAVHAIRVMVSRLRAILAGTRDRDVEITTRGDGYLLSADPARIDASRFLHLIELARTATDDEHRIALLTEALDLWTGPALSGAAPPEQRVWLCHSLDEARRSAHLTLIDRRLAAGEHSAVLPLLERLAREYPFDEQIRGHQMLALYRVGRQADALATYRQLRRSLHAELGIDPGQRIRDLECAILRQDPLLDAVGGSAIGDAFGGVLATARQVS